MESDLDAKGYYRSMQDYYERRATEYDDAYAGTGAYSGRTDLVSRERSRP